MPIEVRGFTAADFSKNLGEQVKAFTISTFFDVLGKEAASGFDTQPIIVTDGYVRKDPRQVRPFGRIEARARSFIGDAVTWLLEELRRLSPVKTHRYQNSHVVIVDGQIVTNLATLKAGERVMIANIQPYAGRIEGRDAWTRWEVKGGKSSRRAKRKAWGAKKSQMSGWSPQAPNGVYRVAIKNLNKKFGRSIVALYQPQVLPASVGAGAMVRRRDTANKSRAQVYPTIVLGVLN